MGYTLFTNKVRGPHNVYKSYMLVGYIFVEENVIKTYLVGSKGKDKEIMSTPRVKDIPVVYYIEEAYASLCRINEENIETE